MTWARTVLASLLVLLMLAPALRAEPARIKTGIYVTSLSNIDPADGSFRLAAYLWFIGPPGVFNPDTDLQLAARTSKITTAAPRRLPDGRDYVVAEIEAVVNQKFALQDYPFDAQALRLELETNKDVTKLVLEPDNTDSLLGDSITVPVWQVQGLRLVASDKVYDTGFGYRTERPTFSRIDVVIDIQRGKSLMLLEKFTSFVVALILTAFVFAVPPTEIGTRVGIITSSIFAAVFNRYRLEDSIGFDTSFGLVDRVSLLTFSAILCTLAVSLYVHRLARAQPGRSVAVLDRRLGAVVLGVHLALLMLVFLLALT